MTEEEIYEGCRRGDNAARKELYVRYAGKLLTIGMRYLADKNAAEDVLHDVFVKTLSSFGKFKYIGKGSVQAWITKVMVNECIEYLRKKRQTETIPIENLTGDIQDNGYEIDNIPEKVLLQFIRELPAGYRTVFNLYVFERKSHREIAETLGINEKSSSSQLFRARAMLGKKVNDYLMKENIK